jgi:hypothetical protein
MPIAATQPTQRLLLRHRHSLTPTLRASPHRTKIAKSMAHRLAPVAMPGAQKQKLWINGDRSPFPRRALAQKFQSIKPTSKNLHTSDTRVARLILCRTPHRRFRTAVITHRPRPGAFHRFSSTSVRCQVTIAHFFSLREGVAACTNDQHGRRQNKKTDPLTSGDHMGQINFSGPGSNRRRKRALQSAFAISGAVGVILR